MHDLIVDRTQKWVNDLVIGHNLCPFARKVQLQNRIDYIVDESEDTTILMTHFLEHLQVLDRIPAEKVDTSFFIIPNGLKDFEEYLDFVAAAEDFMIELGYEGIFQFATFHPEYQFARTAYEDVENYTNRSPYPILHVLREKSMAKALENYENPEAIPERNIETMKRLGLAYLRNLIE